jgi:type I restriction enzyme S subunit
LGELGHFYGGLQGKSKADFSEGNAPYVSYMNVFGNIATDVAPETMVRVEAKERQNRVRRGDVLFTSSSETPDECGMSSVVTKEPPGELYLNSFCIGFRPNDLRVLLPDFAKHLLRSAAMRRQIARTASGVTRFNVSRAKLAKIAMPIPTNVDQWRIASMLDKFDALANDMSIGLPAELEARRKQYEYYRDRLLTFEEAA